MKKFFTFIAAVSLPLLVLAQNYTIKLESKEFTINEFANAQKSLCDNLDEAFEIGANVEMLVRTSLNKKVESGNFQQMWNPDLKNVINGKQAKMDSFKVGTFLEALLANLDEDKNAITAEIELTDAEFLKFDGAIFPFPSIEKKSHKSVCKYELGKRAYLTSFIKTEYSKENKPESFGVKVFAVTIDKTP